MRTRRSIPWLVVLLALAGCGEPEPAAIEVPERAAYREWLMVEPAGMVCGDGSPYRFFVNYSDVANDVVMAFEPGGACWDFDSCTGNGGIRGAANVHGLEPSHWEIADRIIPFFRREDPESPTRDWNLVYVPYCTGDVHAGNRVATYADPTGAAPDVEFHHNGRANVQAVIDWMAGEFTSIPKLLVTGCSAGGAGSTVNYHFIRQGLAGVEQSYLLADSGPVFPSAGYSGPLQDTIRAAWDIDSILGGLPASFDPTDLGSLNRVLGGEYPDDRLGITYFQRDFNYSLYSYERFYDAPDKEAIMSMWASDTDRLVAELEPYPGMAYYLPYYRALNDSHCDTIITYDGSEIQEADMTLDRWVGDLLDEDAPLVSLRESPQPGEDDGED